MKAKTKVWLIIAACLVVLGCIIFAGVMTTLEWDFMKLSTEKHVTNTHDITEVFDNISIDTNTADIEFVLSQEGGCQVECREEENAKHSVSVKEGTLTVELIDERSVYNFFGLNLNSPKITVCLPKTEYTKLLISGDTSDVEVPKDFTFNDADISLDTGDVDFCASATRLIKIETDTGDIRAKNIHAGALDLEVNTGDITVLGVTCEGDITVDVSTGKARLSNIQCKNLLSSGDSGDISLDNVIAAEKFSIERDTGNVTFKRSDAAQILVETDTGDVSGTLLTDKVFITRTDTGSIDVPKTTTGGRCDITTDTGDIKITTNSSK